MTEVYIYEIHLEGHLPAHWSRWFEGLSITCQPDGSTTLRGPLADQAALQGLLLKIFNLGLPLIAVQRSDPGPASDFQQPPIAKGDPP